VKAFEEMEPKDLEQLLKNAKYKHLADETLVSYRDKQLGRVGLAIAEAHLRRCLICERRLSLLKEEQEARDSYVVTDKDRALFEEAKRKVDQPPTPPGPIRTAIQRAATYFNELLTAWVIPYSEPAMRGSEDGEEVWRHQSEDGLLTAWAVMKPDFSLTVHFESTELAWEGLRFQFRLGPFTKEVTLEREGDSKVVAKVVIPRRQLAKNMADISIEIL
jgi:hypothetical protein